MLRGCLIEFYPLTGNLASDPNRAKVYLNIQERKKKTQPLQSCHIISGLCAVQQGEHLPMHSAWQEKVRGSKRMKEKKRWRSDSDGQAGKAVILQQHANKIEKTKPDDATTCST